MAKPGRKSAAELSMPGSAVSMGERPPPPLSLNPRAMDEWHRVVNAMPSSWFGPETISLLQAYCEHVAEGEAIQMMLEKVRATAMTDDLSYKWYSDLLKDKKSQTGMALSCATKMRLTQQASYTTQAAGTTRNNASPAKPWDT